MYLRKMSNTKQKLPNKLGAVKQQASKNEQTQKQDDKLKIVEHSKAETKPDMSVKSEASQHGLDEPALTNSFTDDIDAIKSKVKFLIENLKTTAKGRGVKYKGKEWEPKMFEDTLMKTIQSLKEHCEIEMKTLKANELKRTNEKNTSSDYEKLVKQLEKDRTDMLEMLKDKQPKMYETVEAKSKKWDVFNFSPNFCTEMLNELVQRENNTNQNQQLQKETRELKSFLLTLADIDSQSSIDHTCDLEKLKEELKTKFRANKTFRQDVIKSTERCCQIVKSITDDKQEIIGNTDVYCSSTDEQDEDMIQFNKDICSVTDSIKKFRQRTATIEKDLNDANSALHLRLSTLAGSRLTAGNPSITNLGDQNRPIRIGEMFSEFYDNEWTDAFEQLGKKSQEDKILQTLYSTVVFCYKICSLKANAVMDEFLKNARKAVIIDKHEAEVKSLVKQIMRSTVEETSQEILKDVRSKKDKSLQKLQNEAKIDKALFDKILPSLYFEKCLKLCWKMVVQDPPMLIVEGPKKDGTFDRELFREYTSSGTKVIFTIWPALLLHERGAFLCKGVVKVK